MSDRAGEASDQPWLDDDNGYIEIDLPARQPERRTTGGGRLAMLRGEHAMILARYDGGAMPPAVYAVVRNLEIEMAEIQMRNSS